MPLKYRGASGSFVIGAAVCALRLTALGLKDFAGFLSGDSLFPIAPGSPTQNLRLAYPFKPVGPYPLIPPMADSNEDRASAEVRPDTRPRSDAKRHWFRGTAAAGLGASD